MSDEVYLTDAMARALNAGVSNKVGPIIIGTPALEARAWLADEYKAMLTDSIDCTFKRQHLAEWSSVDGHLRDADTYTIAKTRKDR